MKILVTGSAGYIGSILVPYLLSKGLKVEVIDNLMYNQTPFNSILLNKDFSFTRGDIRDINLIKKSLSNADVILPLAALVGAPICSQDPITAKSVNLNANKIILENISRSQHVIMPTTNSAYGQSQKNEFCDENSELNPISQYALEKVELEDFLLNNCNAISYRLATVFGMSPRMRIDLLVNDFVYKAVTDKYIVLFESSFRRNFIHVFDVARSFLHAIERFDQMKGEIYNVGLSEANLTKFQLCEKIKRICGEFFIFESDIGKDPDKRDYLVSNEKIEKTFFKTTVTLDEGISELFNGYKMLRKFGHSNVKF